MVHLEAGAKVQRLLAVFIAGSGFLLTLWGGRPGQMGIFVICILAIFQAGRIILRGHGRQRFVIALGVLAFTVFSCLSYFESCLMVEPARHTVELAAVGKLREIAAAE